MPVPARLIVTILLVCFLADTISAAEPTETRVLIIVDQNCERCVQELTRLRKSGGEFEALQARGWLIGDGPENHIQIVDRREVAELVEQLKVREFPTVACVSHGEIVRSFKEGCTTPLDAWTFGWLFYGKNDRPASSIPEAARVATTGNYRLRGNHWSIDGDWTPSREKLIGHIRGPNHSYQLTASWSIDTWSYEELRSLHDDLHEREDAPRAATGQYSQSLSSKSDSFSANRKILGR